MFRAATVHILWKSNVQDTTLQLFKSIRMLQQVIGVALYSFVIDHCDGSSIACSKGLEKSDERSLTLVHTLHFDQTCSVFLSADFCICVLRSCKVEH